MAIAPACCTAGVTLELAALSLDDLDWLEGWFPTVAASVGYVHTSEEVVAPDGRALHARKIVADGVAAGVIVWRVRHVDIREAIVEFVGVPSALARVGIGLRAASLLEDELRALGVHTLYAPAPAMHGIALYFWIRLGYRPLLRDAWPSSRDGVAWLSRRIDRA